MYTCRTKHFIKQMTSIDQAIEDMERLCFQLNEKQRSQDEETTRRHAIASALQKIDPPFVMQTDTRCRHFHGECDLQHVNTKRRRASRRHGFLFTDIFLLTKHRRHSSRYTLKTMITLRGVRVDDTPCLTQRLPSKCFAHLMEVSAREGVFLFAFEQLEHKAHFVEQVRQCQTMLKLAEMTLE